MEYIVIKSFTDKDDKHHYAVGERYPYRGFAKKERLEELSSNKNRRGVPLIAENKKAEKAEKTEKVEKAEKPKTTKKKSTKE